jgi:hypothetical protein
VNAQKYFGMLAVVLLAGCAGGTTPLRPSASYAPAATYDRPSPPMPNPWTTWSPPSTSYRPPASEDEAATVPPPRRARPPRLGSWAPAGQAAPQEAPPVQEESRAHGAQANGRPASSEPMIDARPPGSRCGYWQLCNLWE